MTIVNTSVITENVGETPRQTVSNPVYTKVCTPRVVCCTTRTILICKNGCRCVLRS